MLEGEGLIVYAMTCSILYVSLTCLAWRLESRDNNFCATSSWYGLSGLATVGVRFIFHKWLNGKFNYFFLFSCLCAWVKWGLTVSVLSLRGVNLASTKNTFLGLPSIIAISENVDILLSNVGLKLVEVSLYVITKNTYVIWVLFWSIILGVEKFKPSLIAVVVPFCLGTVLSVWMDKGPEWHTAGVIAITCAGCAAALRWIFTQKLKSVDEVYNDPIYCVFGIGLPSAVLVSPFAVYDIISNVLYTDGELNPFAPSFGSKRMSKDDINVPLLDIFFVAICGGTIALAMLATEIRILHMTSTLTMGVLGGLKEISIVIVSSFALHEAMAVKQWAGVLVGILSFVAYTVYRGVQLQEEKANINNEGFVELELSPTDSENPLEYGESTKGPLTSRRRNSDSEYPLEYGESTKGPVTSRRKNSDVML